MTEIEQFKTYSEQIDKINWRIFVKRQGVTFSLVIQCGGKPPHEEIVKFFNVNSKHFVIEV